MAEMRPVKVEVLGLDQLQEKLEVIREIGRQMAEQMQAVVPLLTDEQCAELRAEMETTLQWRERFWGPSPHTPEEKQR